MAEGHLNGLLGIMNNFLKKNANVTGIVIGLIVGSLQGLDIQSMKPVAGLNEEHFVIVTAFGLIAPPIIAFMNSMSWLSNRSSIFDRVDEYLNLYFDNVTKYLNLYFFMFACCLSFGLLGWLSLQSKGINDGTKVACAFFAAGGVGFLIAHFVDKRFQRKTQDNA